MSHTFAYKSCSFALALVLISAQAGAQTALQKPECTVASIDITETKVVRMQHGPQKATATSEVAAARQTLSQGKIEECQDHLLKAALQTK